MLITCPSGLKFEARPWTLGDQNYLTDTATIESGQLPMKMVDLACESLVEPGPYKFKTKVDFSQVTLSDITAASIQIRKKSDKTTKFDFDFPCQHCGTMQEAHIDLDEVDIFVCSDEGIEHIDSGAPLTLEAETDAGKAVVHLKLLLGKDLSIVAKWQDKDPAAMLEIQACLAIQKIVLPGTNNPIAGIPKIRQFWKRQSWGFGRAVRDAVDEAEGGADVVYKHRCDPIKGCGKEQEGVLPLGPEFYGVQRSKRHRKGAEAIFGRRLRREDYAESIYYILARLPRLPNLAIGGLEEAHRLPLWLADRLQELLEDDREATIKAMSGKKPLGG